VDSRAQLSFRTSGARAVARAPSRAARVASGAASNIAAQTMQQVLPSHRSGAANEMYGESKHNIEIHQR
jgi:hypothetical protein